MAGERWQGTRAGQHFSLVVVVKEDGGMPVLDFQPGDMRAMDTVNCLVTISNALLAQQIADTEGQETDEHVG